MGEAISQKGINTGRQREFDYLKGFFMLLIYIVHAFQATMSEEDAVIRGIYMFATMSGAAIFIFVLGLGSVYSREATPAKFVKDGVRMVIYQYLNNLVYVAALLIPYPFVRGRLSEAGMGNLKFLAEMYIQYTNIFFITGIIYFVLALFKRLNMKTAGYLITGVAVSLAAPLLYGRTVDVPVLGYLVRLLIGEADFVSFTPLYFLPYALFGTAFGRILRNIKDKARFYKLLAGPALLVVAVWWALIFHKYGSNVEEMRAVLGDAYTQPDLWHAAASVAHILVFAILIFFIDRAGGRAGGARGPENPVAKQLLYYSKHISQYYALHVPVFFIAYGWNGYQSFPSYQCWLLALLSMVVTEFLVRGYNMRKQRKTGTVFS